MPEYDDWNKKIIEEFRANDGRVGGNFEGAPMVLIHHKGRKSGKDYVTPIDWEPVTPEAWWMQLRCGECHTYREVTVTNAVAERFDRELDRRADVIARTLHKLDTERMAQQVETMIGALRHGLIDAADFAV